VLIESPTVLSIIFLTTLASTYCQGARIEAVQPVLPNYRAVHQLGCTGHWEVYEHHHRRTNPKDSWQVGEEQVAGRYDRPGGATALMPGSHIAEK
jgi:hypothetical protein